MFGKVRNYSRKNYRLCPSHYLGALALSCYAMFNMTKMELELIANSDLYILFEKGTKGGISNKFLINILKAYKKSQLYDQKQESQHIIYLDAYNLYDYATSKCFRTNKFKWIDPKKFDLNNYLVAPWCSGYHYCTTSFN